VESSTAKKIINVSSVAGSVSLLPGRSTSLWYRASKATLNSLMVSMVPAAKESGVVVVLFDPGWVRTQQPQLRPGMIEATESAALMIEVIERLTLEDTGRFLTRFGDSHPW